jgi:hypothetical protein
MKNSKILLLLIAQDIRTEEYLLCCICIYLVAKQFSLSKENKNLRKRTKRFQKK